MPFAIFGGVFVAFVLAWQRQYEVPTWEWAPHFFFILFWPVYVLAHRIYRSRAASRTR